MNRTIFFISLALAMFAMVGNAAASQADPQAGGNLPALRVEGKNLVDANGKTLTIGSRSINGSAAVLGITATPAPLATM